MTWRCEKVLHVTGGVLLAADRSGLGRRRVGVWGKAGLTLNYATVLTEPTPAFAQVFINPVWGSASRDIRTVTDWKAVRRSAARTMFVDRNQHALIFFGQRHAKLTTKLVQLVGVERDFVHRALQSTAELQKVPSPLASGASRSSEMS